ncbi:MAG: diguanylate cyclase [Desulfovibrio sp.]|nr:diguanylate cyclase [Desulfovibrio sp.]
MRQLNFTFNNFHQAIDAVPQISNEIKDISPSKIVLHIYTSGISIDQASKITDTLDTYLPNVSRIGISAFPTFSEGNTLYIKFNIIISENCKFYSFQLPCSRGNEEKVAEKFLEKISDINNIKGIEICSANQLIDTSTFIETIGEKLPDIPIFGSISKPAKIINNEIQCPDDSFSIGKSIQASGYSIIIYAGENLTINLEYIQSWRPIGRQMHLKLEPNPILGSSGISKIDDLPATNIFHKYLGIPFDDTFLKNAWYFPLIARRKNIDICFTPIGYNKNTIYYGGRMYENEHIHFSYCTRDEIINASIDECKKLRDFSPEALLLIICCNRHAFMREDEIQELEYYRKCVSEFSYCHAYGEIAYKNKRGGLLNSALVSIAMHERAGTDSRVFEQHFVPQKNELKNTNIPISFIVSHFFHEITKELVNYQNSLENEVVKISHDNKNLLLHIVQTLADTLDAKDRYTKGHSGRVAAYAKEIAKRYGYSEKKQLDVYMIGLLHDVGKVGIPDYVINKKSKLTEDEYNSIKEHSSIGAHILSNIREMPSLAVGARWHHERYDGTGYPDGLRGTDIPEIARIIAVADAYDAMTSNRSYRNALPQHHVRNEIKNERSKQFDPLFANIMLDMIDNDVEYKMRDLSGEKIDFMLESGMSANENNHTIDARHLSFPQLVDFGRSMPGGFFVYRADEGEELLYVNEVVLDIFGCRDITDFKTLTGFTFPGMVHEKDLNRVEDSILLQVKNDSRKLDYVEYRIRRKDGEIRWVDDYGRRVNTIEYGDVYFVLIRDITEQHNVREILVEMDHLTHAYNRRHFDREIVRKMCHLLHLGGSLSMIMIDIDKFKIFNDVYGHPAGDKCLSMVAEAMMKTLKRKNDLLFRYGGEEFAILLVDVSPEDTLNIAEHLRQAVKDLNICNEQSPLKQITISVGVSYMESEDARSISNPVTQLISLADMALYESKKNGRDRVTYKKKESAQHN